MRVTWWYYRRHGVPCVAIGKPHSENIIGRNRAAAYQFAVAAYYDAVHELILKAYRIATGATPRPAAFSCKSFVPWTSDGNDGYGEAEQQQQHALPVHMAAGLLHACACSPTAHCMLFHWADAGMHASLRLPLLPLA